jgi:hypothetical protein
LATPPGRTSPSYSLADRAVGLEGVSLVEVIEGLDLAGFRGEQLGFGAGLADRAQRLGQLDLLDALVGGQEGDFLSLQAVGHRRPSFAPR